MHSEPAMKPTKFPQWPRGLSRILTAQYIGVSPSTFDKLVKDGLMPRPKRVYGRVLWDIRAVDVAFDLLDVAAGAADTCEP